MLVKLSDNAAFVVVMVSLLATFSNFGVPFQLSCVFFDSNQREALLVHRSTSLGGKGSLSCCTEGPTVKLLNFVRKRAVCNYQWLSYDVVDSRFTGRVCLC